MNPNPSRRSVLFAALPASLAPSLALAQNAPTETLLVLNKRDMTLVMVDPATNKIIGTAPSGQDPHEVVATPDGKRAYISNYGGGSDRFNTLSVVDLTTMTALPPVDLGALHAAHGLWMSQGKVYFTAEANKIIGRYDPATRKLDWALGLGQNRTHMIVVSKDGKRIYTSNVNSNTISIIEKSSRQNGFGGPPPPGGNGQPPPPGGFGAPPPGGDNGQPPPPPPGGFGGQGGPPPGGFGGPPPGGGSDWEVVSVKVGEGPEGFDVSPNEKEVWAANSHDGTISIIDVATKKTVQTIQARVNFANRLKFTPNGKLVLVSSLGGGDLVVFDTATRKEIKRLKAGRGAAGIQMDPSGGRAYIACSPDSKVVVFDLKTLQVIGQIATGNDPDGLAWVVRK